jgi:AraC-like DNA-binding protein
MNAVNLEIVAIDVTEPDQLSEAVGQVLATPRIEKLHRGSFSARIEACNLEELGMMIISVQNLKAHVGAATGYTSVNVPLAGKIETQQGSFQAGIVPDSADITLSDSPLNLTTPATKTLVVRLDDALLQNAAVRLTGGRHSTDLDFDGVLDLRSQHGRAFAHCANLLWSDAHSGALNETSKIKAVELELACDFLLASEVAGESLFGDHPADVNLRPLEDWILSRLEEPISRADLCEVSGLHVRTLTRAFQLAHGMGPMQFIRQQRLDAIRQVLLCSGREETTVTRVAEDFGMRHLGRFSHDYRQRFGERPIDTLSR